MTSASAGAPSNGSSRGRVIEHSESQSPSLAPQQRDDHELFRQGDRDLLGDKNVRLSPTQLYHRLQKHRVTRNDDEQDDLGGHAVKGSSVSPPKHLPPLRSSPVRQLESDTANMITTAPQAVVEAGVWDKFFRYGELPFPLSDQQRDLPSVYTPRRGPPPPPIIRRELMDDSILSTPLTTPVSTSATSSSARPVTSRVVGGSPFSAAGAGRPVPRPRPDPLGEHRWVLNVAEHTL